MNVDTSASRNPLGEFLSIGQRLAGKTDEQMAEELGFSAAKVYRHVVAGTMKLPLAKIPAAARALGVPEVDVLRALLAAYCGPEIPAAVDRVWGTLKLTDHERKLVEAYRALAANQEFELKVLGAQHVVALVLAQ